ncbi:MAG: Cof-type HAD-IIB family hydrolase [Firmicutes bacterium]|nr:Cof-type HAD-IIB family hydrolase [Bacillota bacterium]
MRNIKILAADMDGTLLRDDMTVSERTQAAIKAWIADGRYFVPATGRPLLAMDMVTNFLEEDMPFIVYNGAAAIMHRSQRELFARFTLDPAVVPEICAMGKERDVRVLLWANEKLYATENNKYIQYYENATNAKSERLWDEEDIRAVAAEGVTKILWMDYPEQVLVHQQEMPRHFGGRVNCHVTRPELFEFVAPGATKGIALGKVAESLGVAHSETAAVGDSYNDVAMLEYAAVAIAMGNSRQEIKDICNEVTLGNNEDGVADWIERELAGKK